MRRTTDKVALDRIRRLLHGKEWSAGDLEAIAEIVRSTGREIGPPPLDPATAAYLDRLSPYPRKEATP